MTIIVITRLPPIIGIAAVLLADNCDSGKETRAPSVPKWIRRLQIMRQVQPESVATFLDAQRSPTSIPQPEQNPATQRRVQALMLFAAIPSSPKASYIPQAE